MQIFKSSLFMIPDEITPMRSFDFVISPKEINSGMSFFFFVLLEFFVA